MSIFFETASAGQKSYWAIDRELVKEQSLYQSIAVHSSPVFGRVITLDQRLIMAEVEAKQCSELLGMIPLMLHPNPARVGLFGGCWGGLSDSIHRAGRTRSITQVEIDDVLVDLMVSHWPQTPVIPASGAALQIQDPIDALNAATHSPFDLIILESRSLWSRAPFEELVRSAQAALLTTGITAVHLGSPYENPEQFRHRVTVIRALFSHVFAFAIHTPMQPGGISIAFLCSNWCLPGLTQNARQALQALPSYYEGYSAKAHAASFIFAEQLFVKVLTKTVSV